MNIKNKINNLPQELRRNIFNYLIWTPKNKEEFKNAVINWSENKEEAFKKIWTRVFVGYFKYYKYR